MLEFMLYENSFLIILKKRNFLKLCIIQYTFICSNLTLTNFSPVLHFKKKPVIWFALQIKGLVSIWNVTLGWNRLIYELCLFVMSRACITWILFLMLTERQSELVAQKRCAAWNLSDFNGIRTVLNGSVWFSGLVKWFG